MKPLVLAIDDSRTIRGLLTASLEENGFRVVSAEDGVEGVQRFEEVSPDVVITDINMPNLDGYGVIDAIRSGSCNSTVPIIVLTTESAAELKAKARDAGATGWMVKPFNDQSLVSVLKRVTSF